MPNVKTPKAKGEPKKKRSLEEIREAREALENQLNALLQEVEGEDREYGQNEATEIVDLTRQIAEEQKLIDARTALEQKRLNDAERQRKIDRANNSNPDTVEGQAKRFQWLKFFRGCLEGKHDGLEAEISQEGGKEAKNCGHVARTNNPLPSSFLQVSQRDLSAGTSTEGQETVDTTLGSLIPALTPRLGVMQMGATMLNLTNPIDYPREDSLMTAAWKAEKAAADETTSTFDDISLSPKRLAAWTEFTKDLLFQSSISVDAFVRNRLASTIRRKLDKDLLIADGNSDDPIGLLNIANTNDASVGGSGATPDWADVVNFWRQIALDNADVATLRWLTNTEVAYHLMTTEKVASTDSRMLLDSINGNLGGYPIHISNQVPSDLTDTVYENQSAMIFGNWSDFLIAQFAGLDFIVDPFTKGKNAMVQVIVHSWWDCDVNHPESFAIAKDIGGTAVE